MPSIPVTRNSATVLVGVQHLDTIQTRRTFNPRYRPELLWGKGVYRKGVVRLLKES